MVRPAGLEPATLCLEGRCSIHLSYGRTRTYESFSGFFACGENRRGIIRKQFDRLLFVLLAEMRISLNHIQTLPAAQFLNRPEIHAPHYEPACKCMPQNMRCYVR